MEAALGHDPFSAALFAFTNKGRDKVKILYWERNGFCLWQKRLEKERFKWPYYRREAVIRHVRFKYACRGCEGAADDAPAVKLAELPPQPLAKSNAAPGLLAYIATAKNQDALPLYRQETMFARLGVELSR